MEGILATMELRWLWSISMHVHISRKESDDWSKMPIQLMNKLTKNDNNNIDI